MKNAQRESRWESKSIERLFITTFAIVPTKEELAREAEDRFTESNETVTTFHWFKLTEFTVEPLTDIETQVSHVVAI